MGLQGIAAELWEQEVRVLLRVGTLDHPALPEVLGGGHDEQENFAFVITESVGDNLSNEGGLEYFRQRPADCFRQLSLLADALSVLHGLGLMHRNVWPGAVEAVQVTPGGPPRLRLARFEMSALLSNFLRGVRPGVEASQQEARQLFVGQGPVAFGLLPP